MIGVSEFFLRNTIPDLKISGSVSPIYIAEIPASMTQNHARLSF